MSMSHERGKRSTVPKFASFKPKAPDTALQVAENDADRPESRRTEHHASQPSGSQAHRRLIVDVVDAGSGPASRASQNPHGPARHDFQRDLFYQLDRRGDPLITRYGGNDRSRIPRYRRIGAGRILGIPGFMRIEKLGNREEFLINHHGESGSLLGSDKKLLLRGIRTNAQPVRIRRVTSETSAHDGTATTEYISFKASRKRKRDSDVSEDSSDNEGDSYRSIHGGNKRHDNPDSDEEGDVGGADENTPNVSLDGPIAARSIELSRRVREYPKDVESWLELVDHQNTLLDAQSGVRAPTAAEIKSFADIKLSLIEKALSHNDGHEHRERLELKKIEEGLKVWEFKTAVKRCAEMMQKYPDNFQIWTMYISLHQTTLSTCRYETIKRLYTDKLQSLRGKLCTLITAPDQTKCSEQILYVFLRLTRFLADAGFAELASAAWQATLELNLVRPLTQPPPSELEIPSSFQEYWESEIPRLGEDGWQGWAAFLTEGSSQEPPDPKLSCIPAPPATRDGYKAWHAVEHHRVHNAMVPARTLDEGAEDDPFRVVLFTDFQDILLYFPTEVIAPIRPRLLDAFLIFCHLPPILQHKSLIDDAAKDPFLVRSLRGVPLTGLSAKDSVEGVEDQQNKLLGLFCDINRMAFTNDLLFPSEQWFKFFEKAHGNIPDNAYQWVAITLKQLTRLAGTIEIGPYSLAFESINEPGNEKKSARTLLKQDPFNVDLYFGYSILERGRGNRAAARNILSAALNLPSIVAHDRVRLGIGAAWLALHDGDIITAALQLCLVVDDGPKSGQNQDLELSEASPSQILKASQFLVTNCDYKMSSGDITQATIYAEGLVLLDYLTQRSDKDARSRDQGDIWSATLRIVQISDDLVKRGHTHSHSHETFLQSSARLLHYHASHGSFRPGLLREQLAQYISYFPSNTIFLSLFAWRETRLSINDRVRSLLQDHVLTRANESLSGHVFAIAHELRTGNAHSTRAAFERALTPSSSSSCSSTHHHTGLWIAYIRFCHARRELRARWSKQVFYRAVQACPWSKDVFMEAFGTLSREMDSAELRSVYATMCEIGLRIHVDMDEFVEDWRREHKEVGKEKKKNKGLSLKR